MFTKNDYQNIMKTLYSNQDKNYQKFHQKLLNDESYELIGVRVPILRKIAKNIAKNDYMGFIKLDTHQTYEEVILHGFILGYIKIENDTLFKLIDEFMPYNTNWAINDSVTNTLKAFNQISIKHIYKYLDSKKPWEIRFGLTLLLNYYVNEENIDEILQICDKIDIDDYYVMMANAWLLQVCYVKCKKPSLKFLKKNNLNTFTLNKTISKICDSYRVTKEEKEYLKTLRR